MGELSQDTLEPLAGQCLTFHISIYHSILLMLLAFYSSLSRCSHRLKEPSPTVSLGILEVKGKQFK